MARRITGHQGFLAELANREINLAAHETFGAFPATNGYFPRPPWQRCEALICGLANMRLITAGSGVHSAVMAAW